MIARRYEGGNRFGFCLQEDMKEKNRFGFCQKIVNFRGMKVEHFRYGYMFLVFGGYICKYTNKSLG